ncbi:MAG: hypothetical protein H7315_19100 [Herminiimonas sp.]|nr:hypothetical protein [Herminiimonas sp.]
MPRFRVSMIGVLLIAICQGGFAQSSDDSIAGKTVIEQKRIESERARMAARNRPGSRIPYQLQRLPQPTVTPAPSVVVQPPALLLTSPSSAVVVTPCDPGGCFDSNANRYNGSPGGVYQDSTGRTCRQVGTSMQCF